MARFHTLALLTLMSRCALAQTLYPPAVVQGVQWTHGTHHTGVSQPILSPGTAALPVLITSAARGEFVSGTSVHLADGFHAGGFTGSGSFHAWIDEGVGPQGDVALVAPDPATHISGNVLHVNKWEKLEVGLRLPQPYRAAIDRFFTHYYADPLDPYVATPGNVDPAHDLNPYADDSLQAVMTLTRPNGTKTMTWGFFMREAKWASSSASARVVEDDSDPLHPYHIRFRLAPDMEGAWQYSLSIKAPYTTTLGGSPLNDLVFTGYGFTCDAPLPDNHGPLQVNNANQRTLKFEDGTPYFGLGTNFSLVTGHGVAWWDMDNYRLTRQSFTEATDAMEALQSVGGNFVRVFLGNRTFSPEYVNLGVYDRYLESLGCAPGNTPISTGNYQTNCWAFDQLLDSARSAGIYFQACIKPYPPSIGYETWGWHNDAYLNNFVLPRNPVTNLFDMKHYFYSGGDTANTTGGAFYYWKRRYKYIMSRWGYSVNMPIIEPFNEIDQMLTYKTDSVHEDCAGTNGFWPADPELRGTISHWASDIAQFVRGDVDVNDPANSPLGYGKKLFLMSYARSDPSMPDASNFYLPFLNPDVDLIDVHRGMWPHVLTDRGHPDWNLRQAYGDARNFLQGFLPQGVRKPFNQGEYNYYTYVTGIPGWSDEIEKIFHNYDVSFHNEIWASAFSGKFASGCTWEKERVFWWSLKNPPNDLGNGYQPWPNQNLPQFSNALGAVNILSVNGNAVPITNKRIHHHFGPLADFLMQTGALDPGGLFDTDFTSHLAFDETDAGELEAYYLVDAAKTMALGWVHNRNAWVGNSFYARSYNSDQNFMGCTEPAGAVIDMEGFAPNTDYTILWAPTRMNSTAVPASMDATANANGVISLDLTGEFGGTANNYMDTLRADYAFMAFPVPHLKLQHALGTPSDVIPGEMLRVYPNPAWQEAMVVLPNEGPWTLTLLDVTGRQVLHLEKAIGPRAFMRVEGLASGTYILQAHQATRSEYAKLIVR